MWKLIIIISIANKNMHTFSYLDYIPQHYMVIVIGVYCFRDTASTACKKPGIAYIRSYHNSCFIMIVYVNSFREKSDKPAYISPTMTCTNSNEYIFWDMSNCEAKQSKAKQNKKTKTTTKPCGLQNMATCTRFIISRANSRISRNIASRAHLF